jgi:hypothetical protein
VRFYQSSAFSGKFIKHTILHGNKVDIITCMFALHYFTENTKSLSIFLRNVSECLNENGVFIGVAPDSDYISQMMQGTLTNEYVEVRPTVTEGAYQFIIKDSSNTDYFAFKGASTEYVINKAQLENIANTYDLFLVRSNDALTKVMPNIYDDYPPHNLKVSKISQLYFTFCFVKVSRNNI